MSKKIKSKLDTKRDVERSMVLAAIKEVRKRIDVADYTAAVDEARARFICGTKGAISFVEWLIRHSDEHSKDLAEGWCPDCMGLYPCVHSDEVIAKKVKAAGAKWIIGESVGGSPIPPPVRDKPVLASDKIDLRG